MRDMWRMVLLRGLIDAARGVDTDWLRIGRITRGNSVASKEMGRLRLGV